MKYEILIYAGYAGGIVSILVNIYLFIKLNIRRTFMDLTGLTMRKGLKEIISEEKYHPKISGYKKKHIKYESNKNDTTLLVKNLKGEKAANVSIHDTQILRKDITKEPDIEETTILTEDLSFEDRVIQEDFILLKNITIVHTQEKAVENRD